jgi:hypothetical protein
MQENFQQVTNEEMEEDQARNPISYRVVPGYRSEDESSEDESSEDESSESEEEEEEDQVVPMEEYRQESPYDFSPWNRKGPARVNREELNDIIRKGNRTAVEVDDGVMVYDHEDRVCWYFWSFGESSPWAGCYDVGHGI